MQKNSNALNNLLQKMLNSKTIITTFQVSHFDNFNELDYNNKEIELWD